MLRTPFRLFCFVAGICFSLSAQEAVSPDSTADSPVVYDTAAIPQESPKKDSDLLYRPASTVPPKASTVPPKPADTAVAPVALPSATPAASGRIVNSTDYIRGKMDGERDAKGNGIWFVAGLPGACCYGIGVGGIVISYIATPSPPESAYIGKPVEYIMGYTEGYKNKGRLKNAKYASLGCLAGTVIEVALYVIFIMTLDMSY